ncbi:MAG TPA: EF-hand domain-containing protein [Phycisphaerae bacterium]
MRIATGLVGIVFLGLVSAALAEPDRPPNPPPDHPNRPPQDAQPERGGGPPEQMLERIFDRLDVDGNGVISKDEFIERMPQIVERIRQRSAVPGGVGAGRGEPGAPERRFEAGRPPSGAPGEGFGGGGPQIPEELQRLIDQRVEEAVRRVLRERDQAQPGGADRPSFGPQRKRRAFDGPRREQPGERGPQPPDGPAPEGGAPPPERAPLGGPRPPHQPPPPNPPGPGAGRA